MSTPTFPTYDTVDLFAGPGGWSVAAQRLGLREIGLEFDKAAHLTRRAAGFHTIRDDVRKWGPTNFPNARGLIASPPCQTFSAAGKGAGRRALGIVVSAVRAMGQGNLDPTAHEWEDDRTGLVLEPLRWALDAIRLGQPYEWLAFEQVPTVLPVWQAMADVLRAEGYSVAVGNLQAEQYGVPQTRKRAVLIATSRYVPTGRDPMPPAELPTPTHSRYHTRDKARMDLGVLPWVSMAQALGWDGFALEARHAATLRYGERMNATDWVHERPATTIVGSFKPEIVAAPGYRTSVSRQNAAGSVRVSVEEAACLQSFPDGFPWQGSRTKQYQQIGNAIPPLLAEAVLAAVLGVPFVPAPAA